MNSSPYERASRRDHHPNLSSFAKALFFALAMMLTMTNVTFANTARVRGSSAVPPKDNGRLLTGDALLQNSLLGNAIVTPTLLPGGPQVAVLGGPGDPTWNTDVQAKLVSTGLFSQVDVINVKTTTPTLVQLLQYDAVLVFSDSGGFLDKVALGDNLADYADAGGGVVVATFAFNSSGLDISGRLATGGYLPFTQSDQSGGNGLTLVPDDPSHPILNGVTSFNGGSSGYHAAVSMASGASLVAHWSNNRPLVGVKETGGERVVGLNFYPPSSDARSDFWNASTDGGLLMGNALVYAANQDCSNENVLIIYDENNSNTQALKTALETAGMTVTLSDTNETGYNGTNPSPAGFGTVIHMNGSTPYDDMPLAGQQALVAFVQNGGGYVGGAWNTFEFQFDGGLQSMRDLVLLTNYSGQYSSLTLTENASQSAHPILANLPASFTISNNISFENATAYPFAADPVTTLLSSQNGGPILAVRNVGQGRAVHFGIAPNWIAGDANFSNPNIQQVYIDSVKWAGSSCDSLPVNTVPIAVDDPLSTDEDTPLSDNVLTNDTDADGDALTATLVSGPTNDPAFVLNTDGSFTYTPAADFNGSDSFTYKVNDGTVDSNVATVTITVNSVNDAPVLAGVPALATTDEMVAYGFTATATDPSDAPANNLSFSLVGEPTGAAIDPATGAFTWTPTEAQGPGDHTFTVKVTDDGTPAISDEQSITITVNEVNVAPVLGTVGNQTGNWGNNIGFTATASDSDLPANSLSFSLIGGPAGAGINSATGLFAWTPLPGQIGMHTFTVRVTDNGTPSLFDEETITVTVTKRPTTLVYGGDLSEQYSDQASLSATLTDSQTGLPIAGRTVGFVIGTQNTSGVTNASGVATASLILTQNPDLAYNVVSSFVEDAYYLASGDSDAFDILDEDAQAYYTGALYAGTSSTTSSTATVTLAATVKDIAALCDPIAVPGCDQLEGDIRNAKVTFVNRDVPAPNWTGFQIIAADVPVGLVDLGDAKVGTASQNVSINIGTAESLSITVGVFVNGWYVGDSAGDSTVITISKPIPGLVTGGGYLLMTDSAGLYPGDEGTKSNFGFNIRKDNKMKSPKGNINIIVRNGGRVYQIKGNAMTSLAVQANGNPRTATFNGKANITDITNPLAPISIDGNGSLQVVMSDRGEPGRTDTIGITLWNKDGGLWFTSNWDGTRTLEQVLAGGNLVVR
jgi:hypothetical protein